MSHCGKHNRWGDTSCPYCEIDRLTEENERMRMALNILVNCEDESSWGEWVREIAREVLNG